MVGVVIVAAIVVVGDVVGGGIVVEGSVVKSLASRVVAVVVEEISFSVVVVVTVVVGMGLLVVVSCVELVSVVVVVLVVVLVSIGVVVLRVVSSPGVGDVCVPGSEGESAGAAKMGKIVYYILGDNDIEVCLWLFYNICSCVVQLYIACFPLRSCWTIGPPSVQGGSPMSNFHWCRHRDSNRLHVSEKLLLCGHVSQQAVLTP